MKGKHGNMRLRKSSRYPSASSGAGSYSGGGDGCDESPMGKGLKSDDAAWAASLTEVGPASTSVEILAGLLIVLLALAELEDSSRAGGRSADTPVALTTDWSIDVSASILSSSFAICEPVSGC